MGGRGGGGVGGVADYGAGVGLGGRVVIPHVIVWIEDSVGAFSYGYVVYCVGEEVEMLVNVRFE